MCALAATLMQQWSRRYRQLTQARTVPYKRARTREYLFVGVQRADILLLSSRRCPPRLAPRGCIPLLPRSRRLPLFHRHRRVILGVVGFFANG